MGQTQGPHSNPLLSDWVQHPTQLNLYTNIKTKEQAESHFAVLNKNQQAVLRKRMQQHHNFISKILYYQPVQRNKIIKDQAKYFVYTEKLFPISADMWVPTTSALSILKGFRRLSSNYGLMRINHQLIKVNNKKQIKVWINEDVISNEVWKQAETQEQMLADIVKIIMLFDPSTGGLMVKCFSINEAINNILHNMTENNKTQLNFSNRTNKNQQKARSSYNSHKEGPISNKYNFRSTKETEDDVVKPINQNTIKYNTKKQIPKSVYVQPQNINYLHNVTSPKSPTFINVDQSEPKTMNYVGVKTYGQDPNVRDYNYSQQNNIQKQSSIQFNSSHPIKTTPTAPLGRPYKPIQYKNQNYTETLHNVNPISSHVLTPSAQRTLKDSQKFSETNNRPFLQNNYQFDRKSNLTKTYLQRMQISQDSDGATQDKNKGSVQFNERSQANTSRQFMQTHSFTKNRNGTTEDPASNAYVDSNRTKTQQFYSSSNNDHFVGYSPRLRTHYLQSTSQIQNLPHSNQMPKQMVAQSGISIAKSQTPTISERRPQVSTQKVKNESQQDPSQQQRRRQMKLKQAQRIKQQMSCLGIQTNTKTLTNDKSERDLLIRQRIDQKNKKHEKLKIQITRLLGGDNDS